jgi:hypothetical protein
MKQLPILLLGLICGVPQGGEPAQDPPKKVVYAVVVNATNPIAVSGDAARTVVKDLFLKNLGRWPNGTEAKPYAREAASVEMAGFQKEILGMSEAELARHWLRQKNTNGTTPPKEVDNDRLVLKFVGKHDGAFGIVRADAAKAEGVKVLCTFTVTP